MHIQGFVIHLKRASQRRGQVETLLANAPCAMMVFDAVDGQAITDAELSSVLSEKPLLRPSYPFQIGRGEIACFLSHRAIWQRMVEEGIDQALILEDDVALGQDFLAAFDCVSQFVGLDGFVQFQTRTIRDVAEIVEQNGRLRIIRPNVVPRRTSAQLVGRKAAERLLAKSQQIDRPVDGFLQLVWETGQAVHCAVPSGVTDMTDMVGGTTIQRKDGATILKKLRRAYNRTVYRAAVLRLSQFCSRKDHCSQTKS
jgi:glycosyl transferase, family 25